MMLPSEQLESRHQPAEIWIAVAGISETCALCDEAINPGETVVEGVDGECLHFVCLSFNDDEEIN